jgi:hypothetical protein
MSLLANYWRKRGGVFSSQYPSIARRWVCTINSIFSEQPRPGKYCTKYAKAVQPLVADAG